MLGFPTYLWRLLPANPILLRVVESGGKRMRDLIIRCIYLGLLVLLVLFSLGNVNTGSLSELSIQSTRIFSNLSTLQLMLVALLAPIFTAGAITQEKDSQTYDILLATPLSNGQIVFGSLFSRLFFVFALLLSGIPIFSITQVFGGVAIGDIVLSVLIAAATALVTGALAIAIATFKVGTRRTIFSFYLWNVLYLVGFYLLDQVEKLNVPLDPSVTLASGTRAIGLLTPFHPFLALNTVLDPVHYVTPSISQLAPALRDWPMSWAYTHPAGFYITFQSLLSLVLVLPSMVLLRRMAQSTNTVGQWLFGWLPIAHKEKIRKPRNVWNNPIAWREAKTKASAARSVVLRYGFIVLGMIGTIVLAVGYSMEATTPKQFVDSGSYSPADQTVFIRGTQPKVYGIDSHTAVTINGAAVEADRQLNGHYAVDSAPDRDCGAARRPSRSIEPARRSADRSVHARCPAPPARHGDRRGHRHPADHHQRLCQHRHAREGRRHARPAARDAHHQPLLRLGQDQRARQPMSCPLLAVPVASCARLRRVRPVSLPRQQRRTDQSSSGSCCPRRSC